ncbi:MAG: chorismate mutase [Hyphomonadaceae bacterium]|nr:chorismate mutase [Hyphomonadaceae bacterium]MBC6413140.1 chorismate mutase [Hyphomonadaceae bacterium]
MIDSSRTPDPDISDLRQSIDRVDQRLLSLIAERLRLADCMRQAKNGSQVWRPAREQALVRRLVEMSSGVSSGLVSRVWAELMSASLALQGPMRLHVSLEGDALDVGAVVRDRFGAALPVSSYPTAGSALAAAYGDPEGVAIVAAPSEMNNWWSALCRDGVMPDMHILTGLPRVRETDWPTAVAVATSDLEYDNQDNILLAVTDMKAFHASGLSGVLKAETGGTNLVMVRSGWETATLETYLTGDNSGRIVGYLSKALDP